MTNDSILDTIKHIQQVQWALGVFASELQRRAIFHDRSKLEEPELSGYAGLSEALKGLEYGSDEHRAAFTPYKAIIKRHYEHNDHHPEHFQAGINDMDLLQIVEMLCDWKAASLRSNDTLKASLDISIQRFQIGEQLALILRSTVDALGW